MSEPFALVATALLFLGGIVVLAFGAWGWSRATAEAVRVRAHRNQAESEEFTMGEARSAIEGARPAPRATRLTDEEIANAQRYESEVERRRRLDEEAGEYADTITNEGIEPEQAFGGGLYREHPP